MLGQADDATCAGGGAADRAEEWPLQLMPATSHVAQTDRGRDIHTADTNWSWKRP